MFSKIPSSAVVFPPASCILNRASWRGFCCVSGWIRCKWAFPVVPASLQRFCPWISRLFLLPMPPAFLCSVFLLSPYLPFICVVSCRVLQPSAQDSLRFRRLSECQHTASIQRSDACHFCVMLIILPSSRHFVDIHSFVGCTLYKLPT